MSPQVKTRQNRGATSARRPLGPGRTAPKRKLLLAQILLGMLLLLGTGGAVLAQSSGGGSGGSNGNNLQGDSAVDDSWPIQGPGDVRIYDYFRRYPAAAVFGPKCKENPKGKDEIDKRESKGPGQVNHAKSGPVYVWPVPIPAATSAVPTKRDEGINEHMLKTFGYPISDTQYQMIHRWNQQIMLEQMFDPERMMWLGAVMGNTQAQDTSNAMANNIRNQAASAIDYVGCSIYNFTVDDNNKWNKVRNELFLPMAILLLLPGAVLAQVKAIVNAGMPIGETTSPFEGIIRSIVAIFLIPATYLVVNYGIDVNNSITFTIWDEYDRIFHRDMYKDALCTVVRAFPVRLAQENRNAMDKPSIEWQKKLNLPPEKRTPATPLEARTLAVKYEDPCEGINDVPEERNDERAPFLSTGQRMITNTSNAALATAWNILCAFQVVLLMYLWFVGPVVAALWVYPMQQLRSALPSWCEGVITLCFWSLFWNTTVLLFACFKGVDETGSIITSALMFLSTASVKFAFDFAGLVKEAGASAAGQAVGQTKAMGKGASPAGAQSGQKGTGSGGGGSRSSSGGESVGTSAHAGAGSITGDTGSALAGSGSITGGGEGVVSGALVPASSLSAGGGGSGGDGPGRGGDPTGLLTGNLPPMDQATQNLGLAAGADAASTEVLAGMGPVPGTSGAGMDVNIGGASFNSSTLSSVFGGDSITNAAFSTAGGLAAAGMIPGSATAASLTAGGDINNLSASFTNVGNSASYNLLSEAGGSAGVGPLGPLGPGGIGPNAPGAMGSVIGSDGNVVPPGSMVTKEAAFQAFNTANQNTQNLNLVDPTHAQQRNDALKAFQDELMAASGQDGGSGSFQMTQGLNVAMQGQLGEMAMGNTAIAQASFAQNAGNVGNSIGQLLSTPDGKVNPAAVDLAQNYNNLFKDYQQAASSGPMSSQQLLNYQQSMQQMGDQANALRQNPGMPSQFVEASPQVRDLANNVQATAQTAFANSQQYAYAANTVANGGGGDAMPYSSPSTGAVYNQQQQQYLQQTSGGGDYSYNQGGYAAGTSYSGGYTAYTNAPQGSSEVVYGSGGSAGGGYGPAPQSAPTPNQYYDQGGVQVNRGDAGYGGGGYGGGGGQQAYVNYPNQAAPVESQYRAPSPAEGYAQYRAENAAAMDAQRAAYVEKYGYSYSPEVLNYGSQAAGYNSYADYQQARQAYDASGGQTGYSNYAEYQQARQAYEAAGGQPGQAGYGTTHYGDGGHAPGSHSGTHYGDGGPGGGQVVHYSNDAYYQQGVQPSGQQSPTYDNYNKENVYKSAYAANTYTPNAGGGQAPIMPMISPPARSNPLRGGFGFYKAGSPSGPAPAAPQGGSGPRPAQPAPQNRKSGSLADDVFRNKKVYRKKQPGYLPEKPPGM